MPTATRPSKTGGQQVLGELVEDADGNPAILFENDWQRRTTAEKNPDLTFLAHPAR